MKNILVYSLILTLLQLTLSINGTKYENLIDALQKLYESKLKPLEQASQFNIYEAPLSKEHFKSKPVVLLLGEFSTGKTSFIEYILGEKYEGADIGVQPTTDEFIYVQYGKKRYINEAVNMKPQPPFEEIINSEFHNHFKVSELPNEILKAITFVDSPGLFPENVKKREYDFLEMVKWVAARSDLILLFFKSGAVGICPAMGEVVNDVFYKNKVRIILNQAHEFGNVDAINIVNSLEFYLAKVIGDKIKPKVYISSFKKSIEKMNEHLQNNHDEILRELGNLPKEALQGKLSRFLERVRRVLLHSYIIKKIKENLPSFFNVFKSKDASIKSSICMLDEIVKKLETEYPFLKNSQYNFNDMKKRLLQLKYDSIEISDNLIENAKQILLNDSVNLLNLLDNESDNIIDLPKNEKEKSEL